jgi:hypothetical protein
VVLFGVKIGDCGVIEFKFGKMDSRRVTRMSRGGKVAVGMKCATAAAELGAFFERITRWGDRFLRCAGIISPGGVGQMGLERNCRAAIGNYGLGCMFAPHTRKHARTYACAPKVMRVPNYSILCLQRIYRNCQLETGLKSTCRIPVIMALGKL